MVNCGVDFVHSDGEALVLLSGELDVATAPVLREHLAEFASQGLINISVDLSALRFIDSVGLSVFVAAQKHLEHLGGSFLLLRPSPRIRKLLQVTALAPLLLAKPVVVPSIADEAAPRISRTGVVTLTRVMERRRHWLLAGCGRIAWPPPLPAPGPMTPVHGSKMWNGDFGETRRRRLR